MGGLEETGELDADDNYTKSLIYNAARNSWLLDCVDGPKLNVMQVFRIYRDRAMMLHSLATALRGGHQAAVSTI